MDEVRLQQSCHSRSDPRRYLNRLNNPFLRPKENELARRVAGLMPARGGRLLEVGCGEGSNLAYLRPLLPTADLVGLDFSAEKTRFLADAGVPAMVACGDATRLPFADGICDLVLLRDLLHHVNWMRKGVIGEAVRVLKPTGHVVVFESNPGAVLNRVFQLLCPAERGMKNSTRQELLALGRQFGEVRIEAVEASFLVRAVGFIIGWPQGAGRFLAWPAYSAARAWEKLVEGLVPKRRWTYMMLVLEHA